MKKILNTIAIDLAEVQDLIRQGHEIVQLKDVAPELAAFLENPSELDDADTLHDNAVRLQELSEGFSRIILPCGTPRFMWFLADAWATYGCKCQPMFAPSIVHAEKNRGHDV